MTEIKATEQLKALFAYSKAKEKLEQLGFDTHLDIDVRKQSKWVYEHEDRALYFDMKPKHMFEKDDFYSDIFDNKEEAILRKKTDLYSLFLIVSLTGNDYFLVLLNKNNVEHKL